MRNRLARFPRRQPSPRPQEGRALDRRTIVRHSCVGRGTWLEEGKTGRGRGGGCFCSPAGALTRSEWCDTGGADKERARTAVFAAENAVPWLTAARCRCPRRCRQAALVRRAARAVASSSGVDRCLRRARRMTRQRVRVREGRIGSWHPARGIGGHLNSWQALRLAHVRLFPLPAPHHQRTVLLLQHLRAGSALSHEDKGKDKAQRRLRVRVLVVDHVHLHRAPASPATSSTRTSSTTSSSRPAPPSPRMTRASTSLSMTASPRASAAGRGQPGNGVLSGEDRRARVLLARSACAAPSRARQHIGGRAEAAPPRPRPVSPPSGRVPRPGQLWWTIVRRSRARPSCGRGLG